MKPSLLSIAGYDPTCGAGVMQDVATFRAYGWHGLAVPTVLVAEDSIQVVATQEIPADFFAHMLKLVEDDFQIMGVKLGLLGGGKAQLQRLRDFLWRARVDRFCPIVCDPVLNNSRGDSLIQATALPEFRQLILPFVDIITPNVRELAVLLETKPPTTRETLEELIRLFYQRHGVKVLLTGINSPLATARSTDRQTSPVVEDLLFDGKEMHRFRGERLPGDPHGTGCLHSSLLLIALTAGKEPREAGAWAKSEMQRHLLKPQQPATSGRPFLPVGLV